MVTTALRYAPEDPFSLLESCERTLEWILYNHRHQPIPRCWIDHPYGEEEITLLEEELMPVLSKLLRRIEEIDTALETQQQAQLPPDREAQCRLHQAPLWPVQGINGNGLIA